MVRLKSSNPTIVGTYSTEAFSAARFTETFKTPYSSFNARSTAPTQAAQVIPLTEKSILTDATPYPSPLTASMIRDRGTGFLASGNSSVALSAGKFTTAFFTPGTRCKAFSTAALQEAQVMPV